MLIWISNKKKIQFHVLLFDFSLRVVLKSLQPKIRQSILIQKMISFGCLQSKFIFHKTIFGMKISLETDLEPKNVYESTILGNLVIQSNFFKLSCHMVNSGFFKNFTFLSQNKKKLNALKISTYFSFDFLICNVCMLPNHSYQNLFQDQDQV